MGGLDRVWQVCNFMTQTQPNPTRYKKKIFNLTQPNPTHQALKTNPKSRVWQVG